MRKKTNRSITVIFGFLVFVLGWTIKAEALEPKLNWKKEFPYPIKNVDLATDTGDVILALKNGGEIILFDKDGNEGFHWGPSTERRAGGTSISKDGRYFVFYSGYTGIYADKKKVPWWSDDRMHFYNRQTKKELWNYKILEGFPLISPDGLLAVNYLENYGFEVFDLAGRKTFEYRPSGSMWELVSIVFSPDSNYLAVAAQIMRPLLLFKRDGTKLWERGRHTKIASISEGASYISTYPYSLGLSYTADPENTHKGTVYNKNGKKVLEGFGILSGDGSKIAMLLPDKVSIKNLPDKKTIREVPVSVRDVMGFFGTTIVVFSHNGRYLVLGNKTSLLVMDLVRNIKKEVTVPGLESFSDFFLTRDGKYLLVLAGSFEQGNAIYYYQLY